MGSHGCFHMQFCSVEDLKKLRSELQDWQKQFIFQINAGPSSHCSYILFSLYFGFVSFLTVV